MTKTKTELASLRADFAQKMHENDQLTQALEHTRNEHAHTLTMFKDTKAELTLYIKALAEKKHDILALTAKNDELTHAIEHTRNECSQTLDLFHFTKAELAKYIKGFVTKKHENSALTSELEALHSENDTLRKSLSEAPLGFPSLLEAIRLYDAKHDEQLAYWLETKSHPAYTAAQTVRTETQKRRNAEQAFSRAKLLLDYYFSISPDAQEDLEARTEQSNSEIEAPSLDNSEDIAGRYLSTEEYSRLSVTQRNQLAIDLFVTAYEYMKNNPFEQVRAAFFTSTQLSDLARSFAKEFHIDLHEGFELKQFPIIKCNIGREGERIYHLPFDQQYYTTKINPKDGDCYCSTVAEAEAMGFRRAYRWHGDRYNF